MTQSQNSGMWLLFILLVISPLYFAPSLGGTGFALPFNIPVWGAAVLVISYAVWRFSSSAFFTAPKYSWAILSLPALVMFSAVVTGVSEPTEWFFRVSYLLAGIVFFFGLFQIRIKNTDKLLVLISLSAFILSIHGTLQITGLDRHLNQWIAVTEGTSPVSVFLQVNTMAIFMVTGLLVSCYLLYRPISVCNTKLTVFLFFVIASTTFIAGSSGSRAGFISGSLGLVILVLGYFPSIRAYWKRSLTALAIVLAAGLAGHEGLGKTLDKTSRLVETEYADMRWTIYAVSVDVIEQSPFIGHGIGSFLESWNKQSANFYAEHPEANMPQYITHPHNELLLWGIEGGIVAVTGILLAGGAVLFTIMQLPGRRKYAYLALLLPITFHTFVELPFYLSSLHWFVWLILLFVSLNHSTNIYANPLSAMARKSLKLLILILMPLSLLMLLNTARAQQDLYKYLSGIEQEAPMQYALSNMYFKRYAEQALLRAHMQRAATTGDHTQLMVISQEFERMIAVKPELKLFEDVIESYHARADMVSSCNYAIVGLSLYPANYGLHEYHTQYCE